MMGSAMASNLNKEYTDHSESYLVNIPEGWRAEDYTKHKFVVSDKWPDLISFVGFVPEEQVVFYQHAIIVSSSSTENLIKFINDKEIRDSNSSLVESGEKKIGAYNAKYLRFANNADATNQTTYYLIDSKKFVAVLKTHSPSKVLYLNEAVDCLITTLKILS
jgi:hypothetical protein